jgi:hypothetical protein
MNEAPKAESSQGNNFDLARLKRLFGPPVLLGNERMKDFDEYATEILTDQEPGGAVMATLVWQYIVESWDRMRLMRYQSRTVQGKILSARSQLNSTSQRDREEEATNSFEAAIPAYEKLDSLISEANKREAILLVQISLYSVAAAERLARKQALEEKKIELAERKRRERNERAIEHFFKTREEKEAAERSKRLANKGTEHD